VSLALGALLVSAWFAVSARQAHETDRVRAALQQGRPALRQQGTALGEALTTAAFLYPGQDVNILRARLLFAEGRALPAARILHAVTRREPQNLAAWIQLAGVSLGLPQSERGGLAETQTQFKKLDPVDAG
jgi:hypothetical protein